MKKTLLLLFLFLNFNIFAQNYQSIFGKKTTTWWLLPFMPCDGTISSEHYIVSDTLFNGNQYKVLSKLGFLREDTLVGKIWFWSFSKKKEYLVMDLSLKVGDTFTVYDVQGIATPIKVENVNIVNKKKIIQFGLKISHCQNSTKIEKLTFVEGSGPNTGFNYQGNGSSTSLKSFMACHFKDGVKVTGNTLFEDKCNFNYIATKEINNTTIKMYLQGENLKIQAESKLNNAKIVIFDLAGRLIFQQKIEENNSEIVLPDLEKSMYIAVLFQNEKPLKYLKIVK